jgi:hypothetical protein
MVGKPVKVEEILFQGCSGVVDFIFIRLNVFVALVAVAGMILPSFHTYPAKFVLAGFFSASHVIAASILFDVGQTFGTVLGVGGDPV